MTITAVKYIKSIKINIEKQATVRVSVTEDYNHSAGSSYLQGLNLLNLNRGRILHVFLLSNMSSFPKMRFLGVQVRVGVTNISQRPSIDPPLGLQAHFGRSTLTSQPGHP